MSRGNGKIEKAIIAELEKRDHFYLRDLLGEYTKAKYNALYRAMKTLEAKGKINVMYYLFGNYRTLVYRIGTAINERPKRWKGRTIGFYQHIKLTGR